MTSKMPTQTSKNSKKPTIFDVEPSKILRELHRAGVTLSLHGDRLSASPSHCLTDEFRDVIRARKPEIMRFLSDMRVTTEELVEAAMRVCDAWHDNEQARDQMRRECLETPPHLQADLLQHLRRTYRKGST
jgi:hypothetical protein